MQDPLLNGFNKTRNGKRSETGNEAKVRRKTKSFCAFCNAKNLGKGGGAVINPPLSCQAAKHQISVELHCG